MQRNYRQQPRQTQPARNKICRFCQRQINERQIIAHQTQCQARYEYSDQDSSDEEAVDFGQIFGPGSQFARSMNTMMNDMHQAFNINLNMGGRGFNIQMSSNMPNQNINDFGIRISNHNGLQVQMQQFQDDSDEEEYIEHQEPPQRQGLRPSQIQQIPAIHYRKGRETHSCIVCMTDLRDRERIKVLTCAHKFHEPCINQWLKQKAECPVCRTEI